MTSKQQGYSGDSIGKLIADMEAAAEAASHNQRDGVAAFVRQWIDRLKALTDETIAPRLFLATDGVGNPSSGYIGRAYRSAEEAEQSLLRNEHVEPIGAL